MTRSTMGDSLRRFSTGAFCVVFLVSPLIGRAASGSDEPHAQQGQPAVAGTGFDLSWWTIDAGGDTMTATGVSLTGTLGQPDAVVTTGGGYTLGGGFWPLDPHLIFADDLEDGGTTAWSSVVGESP